MNDLYDPLEWSTIVGGYLKIDVSWRKADPVEVLINPAGPREIEALCEDRTGVRWVRFQLNALGVVWFGDSRKIMHGDECHGFLLPGSFGPTREVKHWGAPALVYGAIELSTWRLEANAYELDLVDRRESPRKLLELFKTWRRAVKGTALDPDLPAAPVLLPPDRS